MRVLKKGSKIEHMVEPIDKHPVVKPADEPPPGTLRSSYEKQLAVVNHFAFTGNLKRTALRFRISPHTVARYVGRYPEIHKQAQERIKLRIASWADSVAEEALATALTDPEKIKAAGFRDLMVGAGIAVDKSAQLRGEPTMRVEVDISARALKVAEAMMEAIQNLPPDTLTEVLDAEYEMMEPPAIDAGEDVSEST